ncbi:MAG: hypothetical protein KKG09_04190 [Verrucomicrobia bacterium]|nr:hypothetical protein [Verrucomicrobiota bacterium]MCG2680458.1 hypothetical protein [Kiritimatiellia bacterium]MBU4247543.1 hypothetical protein [Verrucomicrobiota bacterium]MBU4291269.1 hypothetical protein [Verrucomicrobiota bacterium]MBU4428979.1 hypothetical protein [Verrucomicrobiota bacterium]
MYLILFLLITLVAVLTHLGLDKQPRNSKRVLEIILLYFFAIQVGVGGIWAWMGHAFMADRVATLIGWPTGSPFQFEIAVCDLAWGVCGILCIWCRNGFWLATGIGNSIFLLGCAYGHIRSLQVAGNTAPYNAGPVLWLADILMPVFLLVLLFIYRRLARPSLKL